MCGFIVSIGMVSFGYEIWDNKIIFSKIKSNKYGGVDINLVVRLCASSEYPRFSMMTWN